MLLFCGVLALVSKFIIGVAWWQFWPLALVIVGIVQMVVPGERGRRAKKFSGGLILFCMGASLLPISLGAFDCATIARTFANLWPLLVIMAGLFVMGGALKSPLFPLLAALCFAAFCIGGFVWFSVPGPTEFMIIDVPFAQEYVWEMTYSCRSPETMIRSLFHVAGVL